MLHHEQPEPLDLDHEAQKDIAWAADKIESLESMINSPITADFLEGVTVEAVHQKERWGLEHDQGKTPFDWFWLIGYLSQKAAAAHVEGDREKALHHTISTAAALRNWHAAILDQGE